MSEPSEITDRCQLFLADQSAAWSDVVALTEFLRGAYLKQKESLQGERSFQEGIRRVEEISRTLYRDVFAQYERCQPARRALSAIEALDSALGLEVALRRARIDGAMQLLLGRASLRLRDPWIIYCSAQKRHIADTSGTGTQAVEWNVWLKEIEKDKRTAERIMTRYSNWVARVPPVRSEAKPSPRQTMRYQRNLAFWWRRQRAVTACLKAEESVVRMMLASLEITGSSLDDLRFEREDLRRALRNHRDYMNRWLGGTFDPPDTEARIVSLEERLDVWQSRMDRAIQIQLPDKIETTDPRGALPSFLNRWRTVVPREAYRNALRLSTRPVFAMRLGEAIEQNLAMAKDMERANEVIFYAQGAVGEGGNGILSEAFVNARTLLDQCDRATPTETEALDRDVLSALLAAGRETGAVLEVGRAGVMALMTRRQGRRLLSLSRSFSRQFVDRAAQRIGEGFSKWMESVQIKLGWKLPMRPLLPPVVHRVHLREAMDLESATRELPALYRRLFRLHPVEDSRFLVGRDEEMRGFQQAFDTWRAGEFAACLVVGARGSGKTSLLNCAASSIFAREKVVRAQFSERITESGQMDQFVSGLSGDRQVVILEELERTFLKSFNGFQAVRRLQDLIQSTASTTLWILALNDFAFQLLDQAVRLGASFSHRVNAMSVLRDDLVKAILQRHNLSGLRLKFAPPPPGDPRVNRVRAFFGIRDDSQKMFFDSLYEQSGGVFRSAFELWQSSINRVEAGNIEMKQPLTPNFVSLRRGLNQSDHFTLLSILQHGSLEYEELSRVLMEPVETSRLRLDRLTAMDIVAPDPDHRGMRVRPEAQLFVNDMLQRVNLI